MNKKDLIKEIAKREGKKSQVSIGNIREIVKIIEDIDSEYLLKTGGTGTGPLDLLMKASSRKFKKLEKLRAGKKK